MRKTVKVLGISGRKQGVSKKSGKEFDFVELSVGFEDQSFNGLKCETVSVSTADIPPDISLGCEMDIVFHYYNYRMSIDAIL